MHTLAVWNLKGGVGKTTTAVNLGAALAAQGKRVLLVDCDHQASLSEWVRAAPTGTPTLYEVLRGQATGRAATRPTPWDNLWVLPGSRRLREIDRRALAGDRVLWARLPTEYDVVLFDCPASPGVVLLNALTAAQGVVAPVQARGMAASGLRRLEEVLVEVRERSNPHLELVGILVCLYDGRTRLARAVLGELRGRYGHLVFDTVVHDAVRLAEAADRQQPITVHDPRSRAAAEYAALAYELLSRQHRPGAGSTPTIPGTAPRPLRRAQGSGPGATPSGRR